MKFIDLVRKRQSVRRYSDKPVEKEKLEACIEAARLAPSACNAQPWTFIIVDNPKIKDKVAEATFDNILPLNKFVPQAPIIVAMVMEKPNFSSKFGTWVKKIDYPYIDTGIAAEHFCLQAEELGLGTCMLGWFKPKKVKKYLNIPRNKKIGLLISVGYAIDDYKQREKIRKSTEDILRYNSY